MKDLDCYDLWENQIENRLATSREPRPPKFSYKTKYAEGNYTYMMPAYSTNLEFYKKKKKNPLQAVKVTN